MTAERLQKLLAAGGYGSRRASEDFITAGRVRVNGKVAQLGDKADPAFDKVTVDGEPLAVEAMVYILLNKPRGVITSLESQGDRDTVRDLIKVTERVYPVGRLDVLSEGLVLLTNDGELTNLLTHPRYGHEKEYSVFVLGDVSFELMRTWSRGIIIKDEEGKSEHTAPARVEIDKRTGEGTWLRVVMHEGKKHQIRRVAETLGLQVGRLIRVRMGTLLLGTLRPGSSRNLTPIEIRALKTQSHANPTPKAKTRSKYRRQAPMESVPAGKSRAQPQYGGSNSKSKAPAGGSRPSTGGGRGPSAGSKPTGRRR
jgi:23S rRNA pseudouridine2605 synthase